MAPGVVPQSSCNFKELAPAIICSFKASGNDELPLPAKARFIENASADWIILLMCQGPGVHVVASVPWAGPVPPPSIVVIPECKASSICWGQIKWMWLSKPPEVTILPSPAIISDPGPIIMFTLGWVSGLPAFPMPEIIPSLIPISALKIPFTSTNNALVITVSTAPFRREYWDWPIPSRITFPPPNLTSSPYVVRSFSTSINNSVSASLIWSPVVGPYMSAYEFLEILFI